MMSSNPYAVGDAVVDCAQGRPMVVLGAPEETVAEWSERNSYDLTENYANSKFGCREEEHVVRCVYVSDIRSEPSKDYTFPVSRVRLIDVHHADDGRRIWERVTLEVLEALYDAAFRSGSDATLSTLEALAQDAVGTELTTEARELADVERTIGSDES